MNECIFCRIAEKAVVVTPVYETDTVIAVPDIAPKAPVHYLIMPKQHITSMHDLSLEDAALFADMAFAASNIARDMHKNSPYNIIVNNGKAAGQSVFHSHWHFIAGRDLWGGIL